MGVGRRVAGIEPDGLIQVRDGPVAIVPLQPCRAAMRIRGRIMGIEPDRFIQVDEGPIDLALRQLGGPAFGIGVAAGESGHGHRLQSGEGLQDVAFRSRCGGRSAGATVGRGSTRFVLPGSKNALWISSSVVKVLPRVA